MVTRPTVSAVEDDEEDPIEKSLEEGVEAVKGGLKRGLSGAKRALDAPSEAQVSELIEDTDLPEIGNDDDPLAALALRLDRESDLMRNVALREMTRMAWSDRIAQTIGIVGALGNVGLAVVAVLGALVGGDHAGGRAVLLGTAAIIVLGGTIAAWLVARSGSRRAMELAREALGRAERTELRLERLAFLIATRNVDPKSYKAMLARTDGSP